MVKKIIFNFFVCLFVLNSLWNDRTYQNLEKTKSFHNYFETLFRETQRQNFKKSFHWIYVFKEKPFRNLHMSSWTSESRNYWRYSWWYFPKAFCVCVLFSTAFSVVDSNPPWAKILCDPQIDVLSLVVFWVHFIHVSIASAT